MGEENLRRVFDWAVWTRAEINFDPQSLELRSANDFPVVNVDAPVMERKIPHERLTGWRPAGSPAEEYQPREGILGWTIPHYQIDGESLKPTWSLFRAKNHLVEVSWYMMPAERLSFHFKWPQLSKLGEEMLDAALVELEPLVPEGIDYTERYVYIDSKQEGDLWSRQWTGTKEEDDKFRRQREAAERYRALY